MALKIELVPPAADTQCPHPRSGHRVVVDDGNLYVLGGYNPDVADDDAVLEVLQTRIFIQMWKFNFFSHCWKAVPMTGDSPTALASHSASIHGNTVFTFGGSGIPFGIVSSNDVCVSRVGADIDCVYWKKLDVIGDQPEKKYGQCQVLDWPNFYIIGGTTGFIYNLDVHRLDLQTCNWECIYSNFNNLDTSDSDPEGRYRHEVVLHNNTIFVLGGGQSIETFTLQKIPCFDLSTNRWHVRRTLPEPDFNSLRHQGEQNITGYPKDRKCHSCVHYKNYAYIFGGRCILQVYGDLWRLNLDTLQWNCLITSQLSPFKAFFHSAAVTNSGCMYIFGGVLSVSDDKRSNSVHKVWLDVPSLQELVWSRLSDSFHACRSPKIADELLKYGVPIAFVKRLWNE